MKPVTVELTLTPQTEAETRAVLEDVLEVVTRANQRFYRSYPKAHCCPKCAGVAYEPPTSSAAATSRQGFISAERMMMLRTGACGDVAAMVCARMRQLEGKPSARVVLIPQGQGAISGYHAVVDLDGELIDATKEMQRSKPGCGCA